MPIKRVTFSDDEDDGQPMDIPPAKRRKLNRQGYSNRKSKGRKNDRSSYGVAMEAMDFSEMSYKRSLKQVKVDELVHLNGHQMAEEMQKFFLMTKGGTNEDLGFEFKPSHFIPLCLGREVDPIAESHTLKVIGPFLKRHYYQIKLKMKEAKALERKQRAAASDDGAESEHKRQWIAHKGSMEVMVLTHSQDRAKEIFMEFKNWPKSKNKKKVKLNIAKFYGNDKRKRIVKEKALRVERYHCGVGTVHRMFSNCESGLLSLKWCRFLLIDLQKDKKSFNVLQANMIRQKVVEFILTHCAKYLEEGSMKIAFF